MFPNSQYFLIIVQKTQEFSQNSRKNAINLKIPANLKLPEKCPNDKPVVVDKSLINPKCPLAAASAQKWVPPSRRGHVVGGQQQPHSAQQQQAPVVASPAAPAENCSVNSNNSLGGQQAATSSPVYTPPQQQQQKYVPPQANQVIERQRLEEEKNIAFKKVRRGTI